MFMMIPTTTRILVDDSDCGGCNAGQCIEPAVSNLSTNNIDSFIALGGRPSCDCKGTGFVGEHCELSCSLECRNGGKCLPADEDASVKEICGCSKAVVGGKPFAGLVCEYVATKSCMHLKSESKHSFCTNGGDCSGIVGDNQQHEDCICKDGFEGPHCEYVVGTSPEIVAGASGADNGAYHPQANSTSDLVVYAMILVVAVLIGVLLLAFGFRARKRKSDAKRRDNETREATEELSMIPTQDGQKSILVEWTFG